MKLSINDKLPNSSFSLIGPTGINRVNLLDLSAGKKIIILGMPGAFTATCTNEHLPNFVNNANHLFEKGINEILCIVVNDVYVAKAWDDAMGASKVGIKILADVNSEFTKTVGLAFSAPEVGLFNRMQRVLIVAENSIVTDIKLETKRGVCDSTSSDSALSII